MTKVGRQDVRVAAVLTGVLFVSGGAAWAWPPSGPILFGAALTWFGLRGGV